MKYQVRSGDTLYGLAERFYGDGHRFRAISAINGIVDPNRVTVGQELLIPYVTYRHRVRKGDTKRGLARTFYADPAMSEVFEIPSGVAQRDLRIGEWLLIPDLVNVAGHVVVAGETLPLLAQRWYGRATIWPIISIANHLDDGDPDTGTVLIVPRLNLRHEVVAGDTLWELTEYVYGTGGEARTRTLVDMVAGANLITNPHHIPVGAAIDFPSLEFID